MGVAINPSKINKLPRQAKAQILALLEEREARIARNLFHHLFPDEDKVWTGPTLMGGLVEPGQTLYARDKYQAHLEFFRAGATYRERCLMAGNRCLTASTVLDTPDGPRRVSELYRQGKPFPVWSWDGSQRVKMLACPPFLKPGKPECYRVTMSDGSWFECSGAHRILTEHGSYKSVSSLLASGSTQPPLIISAHRVMSCEAIGRHHVYDFTVPELHNYITAGIIHHNTGKTFSGGGYEVACHLTGLYPPWWEGRRFAHPVSVWAAGDTYETTRDIIQLTLLGEISSRGARKVMDGRGVIPGRLLGDPTWRSGVQNTVDTISVKHASGGQSVLGLKSYDQGRKAFQGTGRHIIWFDEEAPEDVYNEALIRTATLNGITMLTFTPLSGLSKVVLSFLPQEMRPQTDDLISDLSKNV